MSTIQPSASVQDLAKALMQTFEANRDAKHSADDFSTFLSRLLSGVSATDSAACAAQTPAATTSPATTTSPAAVSTADLRFQGLGLSPGNDPLKSAK